MEGWIGWSWQEERGKGEGFGMGAHALDPVLPAPHTADQGLLGFIAGL